MFRNRSNSSDDGGAALFRQILHFSKRVLAGTVSIDAQKDAGHSIRMDVFIRSAANPGTRPP